MRDPTIAYADPYVIPIVTAALAVDDMYKALIDRVRKLDETGGIWTFDLRTFALPRTKKSLLDRGNYILSKNANHFGNSVVEQLEILVHYPNLLNM